LAAFFAMGFALGFLAATTELRQIRRELDALRRRLGAVGWSHRPRPKPSNAARP
jgi:hypothetical protein